MLWNELPNEVQRHVIDTIRNAIADSAYGTHIELLGVSDEGRVLFTNEPLDLRAHGHRMIDVCEGAGVKAVYDTVTNDIESTDVDGEQWDRLMFGIA